MTAGSAVSSLSQLAPGQTFKIPIFETPLFIHRFGEVAALNESLREVILKKECEDPGIQRSNAAATWHSEDHIFDWGGKPMADVRGMFNKVFTSMAEAYGAKRGSDLRWRFQAWAMVSRDGDYAHLHTHPNAHFSGVYYVDAGEPFARWPDSGKLEFHDVRGGPGAMSVKGMAFQGRHVYAPEPGVMIAFPAWLPHSVHPFRGEGERIAIACNATIIQYDNLPTPNALGVAPSSQKAIRNLQD